MKNLKKRLITIFTIFLLITSGVNFVSAENITEDEVANTNTVQQEDFVSQRNVEEEKESKTNEEENGRIGEIVKSKENGHFNITFEDGAGYHITGIRRQKEVQITEAMLFDGTWVEQEIINWNYFLIYETISAGEMIFCHSDVEGTTKSGTRVSGNMDIENQFYLKVQQEEAPQQLTVTFKKPVYILDEPISVALTIQNGE